MNPAPCSSLFRACDEACPSVTNILHELSESFGRAIDAKDPWTKNHSEEVAVLSHALALAIGLSPRQADVIHIAGHLHDVGKIGVPDAVLSKSGPLTPEEWQLVREHPQLGAEILAPVRSMTAMGIPSLVLCHHERFDGSGYPCGLVGTDIPLGARIIAVTDSLSAMLQERPYRAALDFDTACVEIARGSGTRYDPNVVKAFLSSANNMQQTLAFFNAPTPQDPAITPHTPLSPGAEAADTTSRAPRSDIPTCMQPGHRTAALSPDTAVAPLTPGKLRRVTAPAGSPFPAGSNGQSPRPAQQFCDPVTDNDIHSRNKRRR